jgi:hypothetical protein
MHRFFLFTSFSFLILNGCDFRTQPRVITSTGEFSLFHGVVTLKVFETSTGDINYTVTHREPNGIGTMGPQVKAIRKSAPWSIYARNANEVWIFDGEKDVILVQFSDIHTTISDLVSVPDLLGRAPRQFLDLLPEDVKKKSA